MRSGTEFAWSPQLRNLAAWDWVPLFLQNKYGGQCRHRRTMNVYSVLSFSMSKHQQKVFMNFFNRSFGHQVVWCTLYEQVKFTVVSKLFLVILMWYLVLVFRSYSCFVTILWSICFSSSQVFASILRWVFHIFFLFLSSQWRFFWLFSTTLYWYCSFLAL